MKTYARLISFMIVAMLIVGGCTTPTTAPDPTQGQDPQATQPPQPQATQPPATQPPAQPTPTTEAMQQVTIRYASWNLGTEEENNIQRQLVQAYIDENPHVTVEFVDMTADPNWEVNLTAYAARGELPDVFMANNVPLYVQNGWLADVTEFTENDPDWENIPQVLKDAFTYSGRVLGLPAAQHVMGYFVNQDIYEAANLDAPEYGFSLEEFEDAVTDLNDVNRGILGLDEQEFVTGWYASAVDPSLMWFSYDGSRMNYNSPAFKEAIVKTGELKPFTWQGLSDEQKANFVSTGPWELFLNQEVGMRWDGSWAVPNYVENAAFEWDFVGIPGGTQALVADVIVVAETAANKEEAYKFARWMSFSSEAYAKEAEIARAMNSAPKMPVSVDPASIELYTEFVDKPGILMALENLDNSLVESLAKIVPGYINARWEGKPGIDVGEDMDVNMWYMFNFANEGRYKYEDYSAQLEEFANQILADAAAEMNK